MYISFLNYFKLKNYINSSSSSNSCYAPQSMLLLTIYINICFDDDSVKTNFINFDIEANLYAKYIDILYICNIVSV